ncbi:hypothetical protein B0H13DRAFT_2499480 [Mycena leptocephala]|nr:hypothetical protein B0H13DRAFT_2499480 [Mycena leptocephala]
MSRIDFATQEPVNYGRTHRKSVPTPRIETHNEMQTEKENRRLARTRKTANTAPKPAQGSQRQRVPLIPSAQAPGSAQLQPHPQVTTPASTSALANSSQMRAPAMSMAAVNGAPALQPGPLRISAPGNNNTAHFSHQLDHELEPPANLNNQDFDEYEIEQDPDADRPGSDDDDGWGEEGNHAVNVDEDLRTLDPPVDNQITSAPVDLAQSQRKLTRRVVNYSSPAVSTPSLPIAYLTPAVPTVPYAANPRQLTRRAHLSADTPSSSPTPTAMKRPITEVEDGRDDRDQDSDSDEEEEAINVPGPGRAADLPPARRRIFDLAASHLRLLVISEAPYADGLQLDKLAVAAWYSAYKDLRESHGYQGSSPPTYDELGLLKKRFHQVKGGVKTISRDVVVSKKGYNFNQENTPEAIAHNRQLVTDLIEKNKFLYRDPTNSSIPGSLFEHPALQEVLNRTFYNDEGSSEAILLPKYFENGLPEKALAFFATALLCVITEYQTGERVKTRMTAKTWQPSFEKLLRTIQDWKVYTTNSGSNLTRKLQIRMVQNARQYAKVDVTPNGNETPAISASDFAANDV